MTPEEMAALLARYQGESLIGLMRRLDRVERALQGAVDAHLDASEMQYGRELGWHEMPRWWRKASKALEPYNECRPVQRRIGGEDDAR